MNKLQFEARLATFKSLSTLPAVMAEVLRLCENSDSGIAELAEVIRRDPALATRILKVANSPFYGRTQQIGSVKAAVMTLGAARVKALALSLSLYDLSTKLGSKVDLKDFWRHSLNVACASELIAERVLPQQAEEAFICGCLHDIGMLVLDSFYPREYSKVLQACYAGQDIVKTEREVIGIDHPSAGEMLARVWNFPERYCESIARHHDTVPLEQGASSRESQFPLIINLADRLSTFTVEVSPSQKTTNLSNRETVAANLGLTVADLREIEYSALSRLLDASQHLDMEVGSPVELLQRATSQLYDLYCYADHLYHQLVETRAMLDEEKLNKVALESLQAIIATFSHYLNNAVASISGRTQLLELALRDGRLEDTDAAISKSIQVYERNAEQITSVIDKLKKITVFKTAIYHDNTKIIDFEKEARLSQSEIARRLEQQVSEINK